MSSERCLVCGLPLSGAATGGYHQACAQRLFGRKKVPTFAYSTDELNRMAENIIRSRISVTGVQPKLSLHLERAAAGDDRLTLVGLDGEYILKLPTRMYAELPESEHFAMTLANLCGIKTAEFGLVRLESGALAYLTRRMDREDGVKHMLDCCQLTNRQTERKYSGSYEQIAKVLRACSSQAGEDLGEYFELLVFCYLIGNSDMHLKNFSLIREHDGSWHLSRAYDLVPVKTVMPADADELALTLNGKNRNLRLGDFRKAAESMRFTPVQLERTLKRVLRGLDEHLDEALDRSFLSEDFGKRVRTLIAEHAAVLRGVSARGAARRTVTTLVTTTVFVSVTTFVTVFATVTTFVVTTADAADGCRPQPTTIAATSTTGIRTRASTINSPPSKPSNLKT